MIVAEIEKEPFDEFGFAILYHQVLGAGEKVSTCTLQAIRESDAVDVTGTFLGSSSASIPAGVAIAGTTTTIKDDTDLVAQGFRPGDFVVNETKGYSTVIKGIVFGSLKNDTLLFNEQAIAAAASDVFSAAKAIAFLKAGSNGNRVKVIFSMTTNLANKFQDEIIVNVKDY
jgi:hypothetical protein